MLSQNHGYDVKDGATFKHCAKMGMTPTATLTFMESGFVKSALCLNGTSVLEMVKAAWTIRREQAGHRGRNAT